MIIYKSHILLLTSSSISLYKSVINTLTMQQITHTHTQHALTLSLVGTCNRRGCFKESLEISCCIFFTLGMSSSPLEISATCTSLCIPSSSTSPSDMCEIRYTKNQIIYLLVTQACLLISLISSSTSSTEGKGGRLFVVEVVDSGGVLGEGVISGELSATFCLAAARRVAIQSCAPATAVCSTVGRCHRFGSITQISNDLTGL